MNKYVAKQIVLAQIASDGGKGDPLTLIRVKKHVEIAKAFYKKGYSAKDKCIFRAIAAIQKDNKSGFTYHVTTKTGIDRRGYEFFSYLIYFNFKLKDGNNYQISFHSFNSKFQSLIKQPERCRTKWKKRTSSKEATIKLAYFISRSEKLQSFSAEPLAAEGGRWQ